MKQRLNDKKEHLIGIIVSLFKFKVNLYSY